MPDIPPFLRPQAKHAAKPLLIILLALASTLPCHAAPGADLIREKARVLCAFLLGNTEYSGAALDIAEPEKISQTPGQPWPTGLGPIWYVPVRIEALGRGHFMFETGPEKELHEFALDLPFTAPTGYGLGKSGWVTATFGPKDKPPLDYLRHWIAESYRAVAPKKLLKLLDAKAAS